MQWFLLKSHHGGRARADRHPTQLPEKGRGCTAKYGGLRCSLGVPLCQASPAPRTPHQPPQQTSGDSGVSSSFCVKAHLPEARTTRQSLFALVPAKGSPSRSRTCPGRGRGPCPGGCSGDSLTEVRRSCRALSPALGEALGQHLL